MRLSKRTKMMVSMMAAAGALTAVHVARGEQPKMLLTTTILGQNEWQVGSFASVRVNVNDFRTSKPVKGAAVDGVVFAGPKPAKGEAVDGKSLAAASARTDAAGNAVLMFKISPEYLEAEPSGKAWLKVSAKAGGDRDTLEQEIRIVSRSRILLTTDKPVYQPGQVIHIRALALRPPNLEAAANQKCTIEVEDSKGNKVFKKSGKTSAFGIFAQDFQLATEINQGTYTVRALLAGEKTEKAVTVERYVLPKFKVNLTTAEPFYLPKQTVRGKIQADYFFGKPVAGAKVSIKFATFDFQFKDFAEVNGKTNEEGYFEFEQELPDYFVGLPLEQGNSLVKIEAVVTDTANHEEKATKSVPVADQPLRILAVPEGGILRPKLENIVYLMASYPDGTPAKWTGRVKIGDKTESAVESDELGMVEVKLTPAEGATSFRLNVSATSAGPEGKTAEAAFDLPVSSIQADSLILRADKAIAKAGDRVTLTIISTLGRGSAYVDLIAAGQTALTKTVNLRNGQGQLAVTIPPDLMGTVEIHAYLIARSGDTIRDTRMIYVEPPDDLSIKISADADQYRPGGPAKIRFNVTNREGRGVAAALGISVVDEAVFALQDMQPGLEKVYFLLEKEIATPRYEIHELTPKEIFLDFKSGPRPKPARREEAARFMFASALQERAKSGARSPFTLRASTYAQKLEQMLKELEKRVLADYKVIRDAINRYYSDKNAPSLKEKGGVHYLVEKGLLKKENLLDQWGHEYIFTPCGCGSYQHSLTIQTIGPDGKRDTDDDIIVTGSPENKSDGQVQRRFWNEEFEGGDRLMLGRREAKGGVMLRGGGGFGGGVDNWAAADMAVPMAAPMPSTETGLAVLAPGQPVVRPEVRIREFFPETMFWNPAVITDGSGAADLTLDMADSITTWRMSAMGSTAGGLLGSTTKGLKVFQDFFADLDLPVALTQNDQISIPVAVYNYLHEPQKVRIDLEGEDWFSLDGAATKTLTIAANDVQSVSFTITAKRIGWHKLTVKAHGTKLSDAIRREIEVLPDGKEFQTSVTDTLDKAVKKTVTIPEDAIADASNILVKFYPGVFSQVVEGLDKVFRMPFGCFEQTSSVTYPNILVLDYLKSTGKVTPELQMKAEGFINLGYQRLVSYEVQGGGFSWFGDAPANKVLTAFGLMEFSDMSRVYEIDPRIIERTQKWLVSRQEKDGSWKPDERYLHEESWGNIQHNEILPTAYITWALASSGYKGPELGKAIGYLKDNWKKAEGAYTLAILANAFAAAAKDDPEARNVVERLVDLKKTEGDVTYWEAGVKTISFSGGKPADLETTGLATIALLEYGRFPDVVKGALNYIVRGKDPEGTWFSTQATTNCLKALVKSLGKSAEGFEGTVTVKVNGKAAGSFKVTKEDSDVLRQVDCKPFVRPGANEIEISFAGEGKPSYQITTKYYIPWSKVRPEPGQLMTIKVDFDRTELREQDILTSAVDITFNGRGSANMVIVDLGMPPGFQVMAEDLEKLIEDKTFQKYELTGRQIIIYLEKVEAGKPVGFKYRLKAKFPIKARAPKSTVYQYYNPEIKDVSAPVMLKVAEQ